ncbi:MAG: ribbon-helix-helix domain-containing protein [Rickettsia endosymbiont of Bryobia graminum]|nr:ribbon-helix-helix domain-containing protein [Rickettsia endosymbiont of Bryobia graminum]
MNFNIYINDNLYHELEQQRQLLGKSRNSIINEALSDWVNNHKHQKWPEGFFNFNKATTDLYPNAQELRHSLIEPKDHKF